MKKIKIGLRKKLIIGLSSGFFACSLFLAVIGSAQKNDSSAPNGGGTFYTVSGNIKANNANLEGANVVLIYNGSVTESTTTDTDGNYSLSALENFSYKISVYKEGYNFNPAFKTITEIQSNQTINFQNGEQLCVPAPTGQTGENYCQEATETAASVIRNGRIAFEIFGNAFAVNPDGTNLAQLPPAGAFPAWSRDGKKLLSNRSTSFDADQEIYISNADGTGFRQITFNFVNDYKANWSPDGTRAVFFRVFNSSDIEIFSINTDSPNNGINEVRLTDDDCINRDPSYSPDGTRIVFSKFCETPNTSGIYTMDVDGANPARLTFGENDSSPAWRPDGERVVFTRDGNLWRVLANGGGVVQLTFSLQISHYSPVYSPDGEKIAFSRVPSELEFQEIYTLNPLTGEQIRVTNNQQRAANMEYPSWQRVLARVPVTLIGGINLDFSNVMTAGNTVATPIAPESAGALPPDYRLIPASVAYDIRTSASFAGEAEICFSLPNITNENLFNGLVIFHNENGELVDRTTARNFAARRICATVTSFSPFVVAAPLAPTAANVEISGRVATAGGQGIVNAEVSLTDFLGNVRAVRTSSFGYFRFTEAEAGQTYIVEVRSKRYNFAPQIVTATEDVRELNFSASN